MFPNSVLTIYEQINPFDGFGQVMCSHFRKLGSALKCILKYPGEIDQINRHKQLVQIRIYSCTLDNRARINSLKILNKGIFKQLCSKSQRLLQVQYRRRRKTKSGAHRVVRRVRSVASQMHSLLTFQCHPRRLL